MDDLISRQAAIEAVSKGCQEFREIFARCEKNLNELPSAEPEIIRCKECKHRDVEDGFCKGRGWPMQLVPDDGFCDKMGRSEE